MYLCQIVARTLYLDIVDGVDVVHGVDDYLADLLEALVGTQTGYSVSLDVTMYQWLSPSQ